MNRMRLLTFLLLLFSGMTCFGQGKTYTLVFLHKKTEAEKLPKEQLDKINKIKEELNRMKEKINSGNTKEELNSDEAEDLESDKIKEVLDSDKIKEPDSGETGEENEENSVYSPEAEVELGSVETEEEDEENHDTVRDGAGWCDRCQR